MNNEYIIVNKTAIEKRIEELKKEYDQKSKVNDSQWCSIISGQIVALEEILSQSTPLIPVIEQAFEAGRKLTMDGFEEEDFKDYEDYISNLKLV